MIRPNVCGMSVRGASALALLDDGEAELAVAALPARIPPLC